MPPEEHWPANKVPASPGVLTDTEVCSLAYEVSCSAPFKMVGLTQGAAAARLTWSRLARGKGLAPACAVSAAGVA